jgi:hypothetical protein
MRVFDAPNGLAELEEEWMVRTRVKRLLFGASSNFDLTLRRGKGLETL